MTTVTVPLPRGDCLCHCLGDWEERSRPLVLLFMDAFGPRPALHALAQPLVDEGYRVLLPDLFYAHAPYQPLDPQDVFKGGTDRQRLGHYLATLDRDAIEADLQELLAFANTQLEAGAQMATVGFCLGGRYALTAAQLSPVVTFAASVHGAGLAPQDEAGLAARFAAGRARIYVAVAEIDPTFDSAEAERLATALRESGVGHTIEVYRGAAHGFALEDLPVFDATATEQVLLRIRDGLRQTRQAAQPSAPQS